MIKQVTIKNFQGEYLQHAIFEDQETQDIFIQMLAETSAWGKAEHEVEILDEEGASFEPKQFETIPSEYTIEIEDVSAQIEQERVNVEAEQYLRSTDWMILRELDSGVSCSLEVKQLRQQARDSIVR